MSQIRHGLNMMTPSKDLDLDLLELGGAVQWQEPNTARVQVAFSFFLGGGELLKGQCERIPEC